MSGKQIFNSLRLKDADLDALITELERNSASFAGSTKREMRRWSMNGCRAVLTIFDSIGTPRHALTLPRNISTTGFGCVHGAYLHVGTRCILSMRDVRGASRSLPGRIVRCKHFKGHLHEVGVQLDEAVRPEDFRPFKDEHVFHREQVDLASLRGAILFVEGSLLDQKLAAAFFKQSSIELLFARDARTGLEMLAESPTWCSWTRPSRTRRGWSSSARPRHRALRAR